MRAVSKELVGSDGPLVVVMQAGQPRALQASPLIEGPASPGNPEAGSLLGDTKEGGNRNTTEQQSQTCTQTSTRTYYAHVHVCRDCVMLLLLLNSGRRTASRRRLTRQHGLGMRGLCCP